MEITFTNTFYLWALLAIPILIVLHFVSQKYSKSTALQFANFVALSRVSKAVGENYNLPVLILRVFSLGCIVLAISGTTFWYVGETADKDYVLAIDVSASMLEEDLQPSRLEAAKTAAGDFVDNSPFGSNIAVLSFSGTSFVDQPLTNLKSEVKEAIDNLEAVSVGGTDFGNAIITGSNLLIPSKKSRAIILLTDGRSNIGVSENTAIVYAITNHVTVHTIGIGDVETTGFDLGVDYESLENIANLTNGNSYLVSSSQELNEVYDQIVTSKTVGEIPVDLTLWLLFVALILLGLDWVLGNTFYRRIV